MNLITELKRELKRTTISALARKLKVSRQHIYDVLQGKRGVSAKLELALIKAGRSKK